MGGLCTENSEAGDAPSNEQQHQAAPQAQQDQASTSQAAVPQGRLMSAVPVSSAGTAVYIGNLQWWTTDVDIESLCAKYGQVLTLKTFEDKITGKSKGYVLVHFAAPEAAAACQAELNGRDIHGKACVVTAAQSQGSRVPASTSAASASTSGRTTPVVRPPVNPGRGMASRQPMVNGRTHGRGMNSDISVEQDQYRGPRPMYPGMGMGMGMPMGMGMANPMGMGPMHVPTMAMGPMGMPMPLIPGMFQPPPPPRDADRRRMRNDFDAYDGSYKRGRY